MTDRKTAADCAELIRLVDKLGGSSIVYELWDGDTLSLSELVRDFIRDSEDNDG